MKTVELPSFRIWRSTDSVVLGRFLCPEDEVNLDRAAGLGVPVLHRPSGGGAVFHDPGNINYSIYLPPGFSGNFSVLDSLKALSFPVTKLLESLGLPWSWEPPNNIFILGKKISGSAQARSEGRLLHHGTLLVETDLQKMGQLLKPGGRSRVAPVVNLSQVTVGVVVHKVEKTMTSTLAGPCARLHQRVA
jgi:lipoate---protein ligase